MTEWKRVKLGDICNITSSKRIFAMEYQKEGIPFYRGKEIIEKHQGNNVSTELFISCQRYEEIRTKYDVPKRGDILLSSVGTLGVSWLVDEDEFYFKDGNLTWLRPNELTTSNYLYLWLNSPDCQHQIDTMCIGSTQKALTIETLNKFNVLLPDIITQKKICAQLHPIMEKIKNNRMINENLSDQIQAIYSNEFDPTTHTPSGILADICSYSSDRIPVSELSVSTFFSTENMQPNKMGSVDATSLPSITQTTGCHKGDVLISNIRPYFKKIVYVTDDRCGCSTDVLCFVPKEDQYSAFLFGTLYMDRFFDFMVAGSKGTKMPRGDKQQIMNYPVVLPDKESLNLFNGLIGPMLDQIATNRIESSRLAALRDTLLPKLMSGELDVSDIDL